MTERHIARDKEDKRRDEKIAKLLINYHTIDTVEKQEIFRKIVELMKKDNLQKPQNLRRIDKMRLKGKIKHMDEIIDSVQTSNITEDSKLVKCGALFISRLLGIKEIKNKRKEEPFSKEGIDSNI